MKTHNSHDIISSIIPMNDSWEISFDDNFKWDVNNFLTSIAKDKSKHYCYENLRKHYIIINLHSNNSKGDVKISENPFFSDPTIYFYKMGKYYKFDDQTDLLNMKRNKDTEETEITNNQKNSLFSNKSLSECFDQLLKDNAISFVLFEITPCSHLDYEIMSMKSINYLKISVPVLPFDTKNDLLITRDRIFAFFLVNQVPIVVQKEKTHFNNLDINDSDIILHVLMSPLFRYPQISSICPKYKLFYIHNDPENGEICEKEKAYIESKFSSNISSSTYKVSPLISIDLFINDVIIKLPKKENLEIQNFQSTILSEYTPKIPNFQMHFFEILDHKVLTKNQIANQLFSNLNSSNIICRNQNSKNRNSRNQSPRKQILNYPNNNKFHVFSFLDMGQKSSLMNAVYEITGNLYFDDNPSTVSLLTINRENEQQKQSVIYFTFHTRDRKKVCANAAVIANAILVSNIICIPILIPTNYLIECFEYAFTHFKQLTFGCELPDHFNSQSVTFVFVVDKNLSTISTEIACNILKIKNFLANYFDSNNQLYIIDQRTDEIRQKIYHNLKSKNFKSFNDIIDGLTAFSTVNTYAEFLELNDD
ncbi:hypothetical protein TRFO_07502 [Tritrichomonas foetus]|uniref:Uncharacterized protein n=1 Tax=Tritrichomonas foetus TaxID=1144522 RepID=A0A1J4JT43_9EUKA|nr:hypothetical protein TRFO_07502 [Tritrichomonas foetus]|eukprot:OHT01600.1 hypothetical protein TRFO_07502 [Tritrichomonas foetus]